MIDKLKRYQNATLLAVRLHGLQEYDNFPYDKHLRDVEDVLVSFGYDRYDDIVIAGWLHDILEDCPISYSSIKKEFGEKIADIVYDVTDELGKNRKEKKEKTLPKVRNNPDAIVVKLADRIANVQHSFMHNERMFLMYQKEHKEFKKALYIENHCDRIWKHLDSLLETSMSDEPYEKISIK